MAQCRKPALLRDVVGLIGISNEAARQPLHPLSLGQKSLDVDARAGEFEGAHVHEDKFADARSDARNSPESRLAGQSGPREYTATSPEEWT